MFAFKKIAGAVAVVGASTAAIIGMATPALADTPRVLKANLTIVDSAPNRYGGDCRVTITGKIEMSTAEAQRLIDSGATARTEVWADDAFFDNRLKKLSAQLYAISPRNGGGLFISTVETLRCPDLDEDQGPVDVGDEIYAKVIFDVPGHTSITKQTNTVNDSYGFIV